MVNITLWGADYILGWVPKLLINEVLNLMLKVVAVGSLMACSVHMVITSSIWIIHFFFAVDFAET